MIQKVSAIIILTAIYLPQSVIYPPVPRHHILLVILSIKN